MAPFQALILGVDHRHLGNVLVLARSPIDRASPSASATPLPGRVGHWLRLLGRLGELRRSHGGRLLCRRRLTTATITKSSPLVHARRLLGRRVSCSLVLLEDETSGFADVVDLSALHRRTTPAVVDSGRVLDLRQSTAGCGDTRASLGYDLLRWLFGLEAVEVVLKLSHELRVIVFLLPQVAPALRDDIALLTEDGRHAVEGLGWERARDGHRLGTGEANWFALATLSDVSRIER